MARLARVVAVGVPHHITQRGNGRQFILTTDAERAVDMELLRKPGADGTFSDILNIPWPD